MILKSAYQYNGGKSRIAPIIWRAFGDVKYFIDPFMGSLAVLLQRPRPQGIEIVNDIDSFIVNFWRAVKNDPEGVAKYCDYPITEEDYHAREYWLKTKGKKRIKPLMADPEAFDTKVAAWWVYCINLNLASSDIASGPWSATPEGWVKEKGVKNGIGRSIPDCLASDGIFRKDQDLPKYFGHLGVRLHDVRVVCGDWERVLFGSIIDGGSTAAIIFDPPYSTTDGTSDAVYNHNDNISGEVRQWAIAHGDRKNLRIVLCGYEGEHEMPENWMTYEWATIGGYGNMAAGETQAKKNRHRERLWLSPHCHDVRSSMGFFPPSVWKSKTPLTKEPADEDRP